MLGPEAVSDGLARPKRGQRVLDRVRRSTAAAQRPRLVRREGMGAGVYIHLGDTGQCPAGSEQDLGGGGVVSHGGASGFDDSAERHCGLLDPSERILCNLDLNRQELSAGTVAMVPCCCMDGGWPVG